MLLALGTDHGVQPLAAFGKVHGFGFHMPGFGPQPLCEKFGFGPGRPDQVERRIEGALHLDGQVVLVHREIENVLLGHFFLAFNRVNTSSSWVNRLAIKALNRSSHFSISRILSALKWYWISRPCCSCSSR